MDKNITRRRALKLGSKTIAAAGAAAVSAAAIFPTAANAQGTDDRLRALIADLEKYDGDLVVARLWERSEIVARLYAILGEPEARTVEEYWDSPELAEVREEHWQRRIARQKAAIGGAS